MYGILDAPLVNRNMISLVFQYNVVKEGLQEEKYTFSKISSDLLFHMMNGNNHTTLKKALPPDFCSKASKTHLFKMVCDHFKSNFGMELHQDVLHDCHIYLLYEEKEKRKKILRYMIVMDPEVVFKDQNDDMKSAKSFMLYVTFQESHLSSLGNKG